MIYAMSDFHLPSALGKSMEKFGWGDHMKLIREYWPLTEDDTIVMPGDLSWGMKIEDIEPDLEWLSSLPGKKILLKGNHDIWWQSDKKLAEVLKMHEDISFVHNNSMTVEGVSICGTRGWDLIVADQHDIKMRNREELRLEFSLKQAETENIVIFMHYAPMLRNGGFEGFHRLALKYGVKRIYYGHLHGKAANFGFTGEKDGITYSIVSADHIGFKPIRIQAGSS